jgi:hypothetical protein
MLLVILAVVQIVISATLVILFVSKGRSDLGNSVPKLLTGLADLHNSAVRQLWARFRVHLACDLPPEK